MPSSPSSSFIYLKGCRQHNLKNFSLFLPKQAITLFTGVSGSGKSSLAFDTIFAEGQRRYLEYLSPQARAQIKQMAKPEVDFIEGLSPSLAVGKQRHFLSPWGTLATYTDIYDFLALLYSHVGQQHSPTTGKPLIRYSRQEIIHLILQEYPPGTRLQLLAPIKPFHERAEQTLSRLQQMGFIRLKINGEEWTLDQPLPAMEASSQLEVIVDRLEMKEGVRERLAASVETALSLSQGILKVQEGRSGPLRYFTEVYVCPETSLSFAPLTPIDFNFHSPRGACPACAGQGGQEQVNPLLLFEDSQGGIIEQLRLILDSLPKKIGAPFQALLQPFLDLRKIDEGTTIQDLSSLQLQQLLYGSIDVLQGQFSIQGETQVIQTTWQGMIPFLNRLLQEKKFKREEELPFVEWTICSLCQGGRLKPESLACLIQGKNIADLCKQSVDQCLQEIQRWTFSGKKEPIAREILPHIQNRLQFLQRVGLGYLELNRTGRTLSDGEAQRVQLASQIGAKLSGLIYILDEPSLGLHRQEIQSLQKVIQELKELGNTVIVVEHERRLISQADHIVELGPGSGEQGGEITFQGSYQALLDDPTSLTGQWLSGRRRFPPPPKRKLQGGYLEVHEVSLHHLQHFSVKIPLNALVGFCGVSGSGKSTLVMEVIGAELHKLLRQGGPSASLKGYGSIKRLILGEKQAERFSARSIPATYVQLMTPLRQLFAETRLAKARGYGVSRFSLNKKGGRCEACEGLGRLRVSMQWMPDLFIPCEVCQGRRYNDETLQVSWENKNFADVLDLSVKEAARLFRPIPSLAPTLELMEELGLGYLTLGQPFNTLSGGEVQRLKLVAELLRPSAEPTLYLLDEPSMGLHFEDLDKLIMILHRLVDQGHSIFMIEHHLDLLRQADWLIELGPGGGPEGGKLLFEGTPTQLARKKTPTGMCLRD